MHALPESSTENVMTLRKINGGRARQHQKERTFIKQWCCCLDPPIVTVEIKLEVVVITVCSELNAWSLSLWRLFSLIFTSAETVV